MKKKFQIIAIIGFSFGITTQAISWGLSDLDPTNKNSALRKGVKDIDPTNPNGSMGKDLHARVTICNDTNGNVYYTLGGRQYTLARGQCNRGNFRGQPLITFDKSFVNGSQWHSYTLNDGTYSFVFANWNDYVITRGQANGVDLKRK